MNKWIWISGLSLILLTSGINFVDAQSGGPISYSDSERDVDYDDFDDRGARNDIDILSLSLDGSSDPIVISLLVKGDISYGSEEYDYGYYFYIDHTGDSNAESTITVDGNGKYITTSYGSGGPSPLNNVSEDGIEWLTVNLPKEQISGSPGIVDIWAMTSVKVKGEQTRATDDVNKNFGGVSPPSTEEDPNAATPSDRSISINIDDFHYSAEIQGSNYDFSQGATGTTTGEIERAYYCIAYYDERTGEGTGTYSWEMGPIDEDHTYEDHSYQEEFHGTGSDESWSTWEWSFHSTGPLDDSNKDEFEDPESYYQGAKIILFVRVYGSEGWNQDSIDITEEIIGGTSEDDDTTGDDDTVGDDDTTGDDDTVGDDDTKDDDEGDDTPGFSLYLLLVSVILAVIFVGSRRRRD